MTDAPVSMTSLPSRKEQERNPPLRLLVLANPQRPQRTRCLKLVLRTSPSVKAFLPSPFALLMHGSRPGHSTQARSHTLYQMARIHPPSTTESYPLSTLEGAASDCTILTHPRQEHGYSVVQALRQVQARDETGEEGPSYGNC
jgi:hypothetical protein